MNPKQDLQKFNNRLDLVRRKLAKAQQRNDQELSLQLNEEIASLSKKIADVKSQLAGQISQKGNIAKSKSFSRVLTKAEQGDLGKLKKSVRGLVVVHPMTALGREMGVDKVTGFADKAF